MLEMATPHRLAGLTLALTLLGWVSAQTGSFVVLSDIHYDPFYREDYNCKSLCRPLLTDWSARENLCPGVTGPDRYISLEKTNKPKLFGQWGCDTGDRLLRSLLRHAREEYDGNHTEPDFVLLLGDLGAHGLGELVQREATHKYHNMPESPVFMSHREQVKFFDVEPSSIDAGDRLDGDAEVHSSIRTVITEVMDAFPKSVVVPVFGNNDVVEEMKIPDHQVTEDYIERDPNPWFAGLMDAWGRGVPVDVHEDEVLGGRDMSEFAYGGYYSQQVSEKLHIIALNTVYYGRKKIYPKAPERPRVDDPTKCPKGLFGCDIDRAERQFEWLEMKLEEICIDEKSRVMITGHIPPGINAIGGLQWHEKFSKRYYDIIAKFGEECISAQYFAHFHYEDMKCMRGSTGDEIFQGEKDGDALALFVSPGVAPIFGNNPGYRIVDYNRFTAELSDYTQYYMEMEASNQGAVGVWRPQYTYSNAYGASTMSGSDVCSIVESMNPIRDGGVGMEEIAVRRSMNREVSAVLKGFKPSRLYCAMLNYAWDQYLACNDDVEKNIPTRPSGSSSSAFRSADKNTRGAGSVVLLNIIMTTICVATVAKMALYGSRVKFFLVLALLFRISHFSVRHDVFGMIENALVASTIALEWMPRKAVAGVLTLGYVVLWFISFSTKMM